MSPFVETPITARELEIGRLCARGMTAPEIGATLGISPRTVKTATDALRRKLQVQHKRLIGAALRERKLI